MHSVREGLSYSASGHAADDELQRRIDAARAEFMGAASTADRAVAWQRLKRLIAQRSPREVQAMERERRIRPGFA